MTIKEIYNLAIQMGIKADFRGDEEIKKFLENKTPEEKFLGGKFPVDFDSIKDMDKLALDNLLKRKDFLKIEGARVLTL